MSFLFFVAMSLEVEGIDDWLATPKLGSYQKTGNSLASIYWQETNETITMAEVGRSEASANSEPPKPIRHKHYGAFRTVDLGWLGTHVPRRLALIFITPRPDDRRITERERLTKAGNLLVDDELSMSTSFTSL